MHIEEKTKRHHWRNTHTNTITHTLNHHHTKGNYPKGFPTIEMVLYSADLVVRVARYSACEKSDHIWEIIRSGNIPSSAAFLYTAGVSGWHTGSSAPSSPPTIPAPSSLWREDCSPFFPRQLASSQRQPWLKPALLIVSGAILQPSNNSPIVR